MKDKDEEIERLELSRNGGYEFGYTGKVIPKGRQVNVDLSDQLREKDANINDLSDQLREKEAIIKDLSNEHGKKGEDTMGDEEENMAKKKAEIEELYERNSRLTLRENEQHKLYHDVMAKNELLKAQVNAQKEELDRLELSRKVGYEFGSTGKVIPRGRQVSVVLCLLLHFDKSRGLIFMCHILKYPSTMIRCSESIFCRRQATTRMRL